MASRGLAHLLVAGELEGLQLELPIFPLASFESVIGKFGGSPHGGLWSQC